MNSAESHYLNCMDENCERVYCVGRRDHERMEVLLKKLVKQLEKELVEARRYDNCACKGQYKCPFHAMMVK